MGSALAVIKEESDAEYAKDLSRNRINSGCVQLNGVMIEMIYKMMTVAVLLTVETEMSSVIF